MMVMRIPAKARIAKTDKAHDLLNAGFVNCYQLCHGTKAQMSYLVVIALDLYSCPSCPMSIKTHMQVQGSRLQNKFLKLLNRIECQDFMIRKPIKKNSPYLDFRNCLLFYHD